MKQRVACGNIGEWTRIILLVLTLPEGMNVQLDGVRAHKMASVSVNHQMTMLAAIPYYSPLKE